MRDAAELGMMITLHCNLCKRTVNFWAHDLRRVLGDRHEVHVPAWGCSACKTKEFVSVRLDIPGAMAREKKLTVREPFRKIEKWLWRNRRV